MFFITNIVMARNVEIEDVMYLKNGSVIRGTIVEFYPTKSIKNKPSHKI
jgi:hypothetical protein